MHTCINTCRHVNFTFGCHFVFIKVMAVWLIPGLKVPHLDIAQAIAICVKMGATEIQCSLVYMKQSKSITIREKEGERGTKGDNRQSKRYR